MKKTFWMVTIIVLLITITVMLVSALVTKINNSGKSSQHSTKSNLMVTPSVNNQIIVHDGVITVMAMTNLPDGTIVKYNLWHVDKYGVKSNMEKKAHVSQGQLTVHFEMDAKVTPQTMTLNTEVFFNTNEQPENVKHEIGMWITQDCG